MPSLLSRQMGDIKIYDLEPICAEEGPGLVAVRGDLTIMAEQDGLEGGPLVRMHSACSYSEVLGSTECDCATQLVAAMGAIAHEGEGLLFYLNQEGRGAGLAAKAKGYELSQKQNLDTAEAYAQLGLAFDTRQYGHCARFLLNHGIQSVRLLSNNPRKIAGLAEYGIQVSRKPHVVGVTERNVAYLRTKRDQAGHLFPADL